MCYFFFYFFGGMGGSLNISTLESLRDHVNRKKASRVRISITDLTSPPPTPSQGSHIYNGTRQKKLAFLVYISIENAIFFYVLLKGLMNRDFSVHFFIAKQVGPKEKIWIPPKVSKFPNQVQGQGPPSPHLRKYL